MMKPISVLVTGATGHQGGAVVRHLIKRGHHVRVLSHHPQAAASTYLERLGAETVPGSFDDPASIERAAHGMDAVFALTTPAAGGVEAEIRQGIALVDAAVAAGAGHILLSSAAGASRRTGILDFDAKYEVEQHLASLGVPYTVVAPVFFMENLLAPDLVAQLRSGVLAMALPAERRLQQVAMTDLGAFCTLVIERRERFVGERIEVASDEVSGLEAAQLIAAMSGQPIRYVEVPLAQVRAAHEDQARWYEWLALTGYQVDLARLHASWPEVGWHSFAEWLPTQDLTVVQETPTYADETIQQSDLS
jgi:uncharacterized protein YbjT (DUF2867 family)